jgi:hypothetical protein
MKKILIIILIILFPYIGFSQEELPKSGVALSVGLGKMSIKDEYPGVNFDKSLFAYKLNYFRELTTFNQVALMGEIGYTSQGGGGSAGSTDFTMRFNYLEAGVIAHYQTKISGWDNRPFYAGGGFNIGYFLNGKYKDDDNTLDLDAVRDIVFGLKFTSGIMVNLFDKPMRLGLNINLGLSNTNSDEEDGVTRLNSYMLELAYPLSW